MRYFITYSSVFNKVHRESCIFSSDGKTKGIWINDLEALIELEPNLSDLFTNCGTCGGTDKTGDVHSKAAMRRREKFEFLMGDLTYQRCGAARTHWQFDKGRVEIPEGSIFCELQKGHVYEWRAGRSKIGTWFSWPPFTKET